MTVSGSTIEAIAITGPSPMTLAQDLAMQPRFLADASIKS